MSDLFAHTPTNQSPPLTGHNTVSSDAALQSAVRAQAADLADDVLADLAQLGEVAGSQRTREHGMLANANEPQLHLVDRFGARVDEVEFHPSWHWLMETGLQFGLGGAAWTDPAPTAHVRRAAAYIAWTAMEPGHGCPLTMTYAAVPALRADASLAERYTPGLTSRSYDFGLRDPAAKSGLLAGMGMTEKQGGSDVRTNVTTATPDGAGYRLQGHKWFTSAPMNDIFLVLAQAPGGLTCFVVPRILPGGERNQLRIVRLKDKLGNRSNASSELEFIGTYADRLGDEGSGVRTIIEMVASTRLDCALGSAALMRRSVAEATWHAAHRSAFGGVLADKPAMRNVLADLAIESEAATHLALRLARAVQSPDDAGERALRRIGLPLAKFWVCKRTSFHVAEALEVLGGNGYVEESGMPMLFRESPLNSIWEGSGNVNALDVLRVLQRQPEGLDAWRDEVTLASDGEPALVDGVTDVLKTIANIEDPSSAEYIARWLAARMAVLLQASLLVQHSPGAVADAFIASRVLGGNAGVFGTLPASVDAEAIVRRATPVM
ncbi:acyl-CoA dehydrogenase family protein [Rudaeicoccus suwonensis]|uniref:Putative acyl-CoA dehydrogenase n=1 Tax=Rudaeicoccus suwonensis TaxID=657409 RepID=A0A561E9H4_9MICO|nr:acyl-CoA dehydrogenase family protein [Rudaeicoccus suwonensis]TWE12256.1 putative acyl-CoA dehydrogenase [Rudaeicoccus suwonensis]